MMMRAKQMALASAVIGALTTSGAYAAGHTGSTAAADRPAAQQQAGGAIDIVTWNQADLRQGYSAERLMDMKVKGSQGENIGDVKDLLVDSSGKVAALIVSHGGVFGIGDKELRVPFNEVKPDAKLESLTVPIAKANVEKYRIGDKQQARAGEMKVSELLDDQVTLRGGARYGDVDDLIIGKDGRIKAIVVNDAERRDRFAFPWLERAYDRTANRFTYDYERNQVSKLRPFNYSAHNIVEPKQRTAGTRDEGRATGGTTGRAGQGTAGSDAVKR